MSGINNYFSNNNIFNGTEIPTQGKFDVGDIVVNIGENAEEEPMWMCIEAGEPGVWKVVGKVEEIDLSGYATKEDLGNIDMTSKQDVSDDNLATTDKTIVGAINELFQSANNGKELIASAIGEPLNAEDTFSAMSSDINGLLSTFKTNMMNNGITVESSDKFKSLIDKIATLSDNEGKGIQYASGIMETSFEVSTTGSIVSYTYHTELNFTPSIVFVGPVDLSFRSSAANITNYYEVFVSSTMEIEEGLGLLTNKTRCYIDSLSNNGFNINVYQRTNDDPDYYTKCSVTANTTNWYAIGVGEEDTTLRDSLASILTEEGVSVTEEDDMASLISKVDILLHDGKIIRPKGIKQTATGHYHTFILRNDGTLYSCGFNGNGQLGIGSTDTNIHNIFIKVNIDNVNKIACGGYLESGTYYGHTFAIKNDGTVWACGYGGDGQLGLETSVSTFTQVDIDNVKQIACGGRHTFIIKNDGSLWACGYNGYGQLGLGNTTNQTSFTQVTTNINNDVEYVTCGYNHTFIIKNDGSVWSCGLNDKGQLGLNSTTNQTSFTQVTTNINNDVEQIACGHRHTFVLKNDGTVWSCGNNANGEVGINYSGGGIQKTLTQVETDATHVFCGGEHTFIIKNDGSLWACGNNSDGQLGLNNTTTQYDLVKVTENVDETISISCGQYHTLILKNDGSIWSSGLNNKGQLGIGSTSTSYVFTQSYKQVIVFVE